MQMKLILAAALLYGTALYGQTMNTVTAGGTVSSDIDSIAVITFSSGTTPAMTVTLKNGSGNATPLDDITVITFDTAAVSGVHVPVRSGAAPAAVRVRPNPVFSSASIGILLRHSGHLKVAVHPQDGSAPVVVLHDGHAEAGQRTFAWDGNDRSGRPVPNGSYIITIDGAAGRTAVKTLVIR